VIDELSRELAAVGIRGRLRARILAEAAEHLRDGSPGSFGDPRVVARRFAEELGPEEARRAARGSFAALVVAAAAYALLFWKLNAQPPRDILSSRVGFVATIGLILLPQFSFVGGLLAPVARTPRLAVRRAALGLVAGAGSLVCALVAAASYGLHTPLLWVLVPAGAALLVASGQTVRAARIHTSAAGRELTLSWAQGLAVTLAAAAAVGIAGASGGDPGEGVRNALAESLACMSGFAVFGKVLGLRR
jgi:hypothetical protein